MKLYDLLKPELINTNCQSLNTEDLLAEIVRDLKLKDCITDEKSILAKLIEREKLGSTSVGKNAAVPHTKLKDLKDPIIYIGISKKGFFYQANDKEPVHLIITILSPNSSPIIHLQILAAAAALIKKSDRLIREALAAGSADDLIHIIKRCETSDD